MPSSPAGLLAIALGSASRLTETSDADLLRRVAAGGDDAAFAEVVRRYGRLVWRTCRLTAGTGPAAEDAFQATFLALAKRATAIRQPSALAGWLDRTARRAAWKAKRRDRRPPPPPPSPTSEDPLDRLSARELLQAINEELARLPDQYRLPVLLCGVDGLSQDEAAARLGWSAGSVKGRLERGRATLRVRLSARGLTVPAVLGAVVVPPELVAATLSGSASDGVRTLVAEVTRMGIFTWLKPAAAVLIVGGVAWAVTGGPEPPATPTPTPAAKPVAAKLIRWSAPMWTNPADVTQPSATSGVWHPDGKHVLTGGRAARAKPTDPFAGEVRVWDAATGTVTRTLTADVHTFAALAGTVAVSPDGRRVVAVGQRALLTNPPDYALVAWDWATGRVAQQVSIRRSLSVVAFAPDSRTVYTVKAPIDILAWDAVAGGEPVAHPVKSVSAINLSVSPDGTGLLAAGLVDRDVIALTLPLPSATETRFRPAAAARFGWVQHLPDGKGFVAGGYDGPPNSAVRLFVQAGDGSNYVPVVPDPPLRATSRVYQVAVSPDGKLIAACQDNLVRLFTAPDKPKPHLKQLAVGREHTDIVYTVQFSPDGKSLLTVGRDAVKVWDVAELLKQTPTPADWLTPSAAAKWELGRFAGEWELESAQFDGPDRWTEVKKADQPIPVEFSVTKLDLTASPKTAEVRFIRGVQAGTTHPAIYDFPDPDTCRFCYAYAADGPRPNAFTAERGSGQALVVLKRESLKKN